jgi:hypothetical protein
MLSKRVKSGSEGDDDDDDDEQEDGLEQLESAMTLTFFHLAPILQNVSGGHWQFIFDVWKIISRALISDSLPWPFLPTLLLFNSSRS